MRTVIAIALGAALGAGGFALPARGGDPLPRAQSPLQDRPPNLVPELPVERLAGPDVEDEGVQVEPQADGSRVGGPRPR